MTVLMGVVELASFERFEDRHIDFLASVQENICVALRAAQSQVELKQLLKQHAVFFRVFKDAADPIMLENFSGNVIDLNTARPRPPTAGRRGVGRPADQANRSRRTPWTG